MLKLDAFLAKQSAWVALNPKKAALYLVGALLVAHFV